MKVNIKGVILEDSGVAEVYRWCGFEACSPKDVTDAISSAAEDEEIVLEINSCGGYVSAGVEMYKTLKDYKGKVTAHIINACSAATFPACAADKTLMSDGAIYMIHNTQSGAQGDYRDMQMAADALKECNEAIIDIYQRKTGKSREELQEMMDNDTYMSPKKAIETGFADGYLYGEVDGKAKNMAHMAFTSVVSPTIPEEKMKALKEMMAIPEEEMKALKEMMGKQKHGDMAVSDDKEVENQQQGKGEEKMTLEELLAENEEAAETLNEMLAKAEKTGAEAERERLKALDALAAVVSEETLDGAKYGDKPMDAKELAYQSLTADAQKAKDYMADAMADSKDSGVDEVAAQPDGEETDESDVMASAVNEKRRK